MKKPKPNMYEDNPHPSGTLAAAWWDHQRAVRNAAQTTVLPLLDRIAATLTRLLERKGR